MELLKTIGEYCQLYRVTIPKCDLLGFNGFVAIDSTEARVLTYHRSKLLGQVVCAAMKRGVVLHIHNGCVKPLEWGTWKKFWSKYFAPKPRKNNLPEPHIAKPPKRSIFDECKGERSRKKAKSGGFEATFRGNMNLHRLGLPIPTRPIA